MAEAEQKPCEACAYCGTDPSDPILICFHPKISDHGFGKYIHHAREDKRCGSEAKLFEQHPNRDSDGRIKA